MELNTIATTLLTAIIMFLIGRFFSSKDKVDNRAESLEDKAIQELKTSISEKFGNFEKSFSEHIQSADESFRELETGQKEINKSLNELKISYEKVSSKIQSNDQLNQQKFETIKTGLDELKKTVSEITQITVKAEKPARMPKM